MTDIFNFDSILQNNSESDNYIEYIKFILNEDTTGSVKEILINKIIITIDKLIDDKWDIKIKYDNIPFINFINFILKLKQTILKKDKSIDNFIYFLIHKNIITNIKYHKKYDSIYYNSHTIDFLCTLFIKFYENNEFLCAIPCYDDELMHLNYNDGESNNSDDESSDGESINTTELFWYFKRELRYIYSLKPVKELFDRNVNNNILLIKIENIIKYDSSNNIILQIEEKNILEMKIKLNKLSGKTYIFDEITFDINDIDQLYIYISNKLNINIFNLSLIN